MKKNFKTISYINISIAIKNFMKLFNINSIEVKYKAFNEEI